MKYLFAIFVATFLITACNDQIYDVDYYFEHQAEAQQVLDKCKSGEIKDDNCQNAREGLKKQSRQDWIKAHGGK